MTGGFTTREIGPPGDAVCLDCGRRMPAPGGRIGERIACPCGGTAVVAPEAASGAGSHGGLAAAAVRPTEQEGVAPHRVAAAVALGEQATVADDDHWSEVQTVVDEDRGWIDSATVRAGAPASSPSGGLAGPDAIVRVALGPGDRVGGFVLAAELDRSDDAIRWLATAASGGRGAVVITTLLPRAGRPGELEALARTAPPPGRLDHPNVARVLELGTVRAEVVGGPPATILYVASPRIDGQRLDRVVAAAGRLDPARATAIAAGISRALDQAHGRGIVHGDLAPSRVLIDPTGRPVVSGFGLGRAIGIGLPGAAPGQRLEVVGTPGFVAPERAGPSARIDLRGDLFSLGAVLHYALVGASPFGTDDPLTALERARAGPPPGPRSRSPAVPSDLDVICRRCLEPDPARRFGDASSLARALDVVLSGASSRLTVADDDGPPGLAAAAASASASRRAHRSSGFRPPPAPLAPPPSRPDPPARPTWLDALDEEDEAVDDGFGRAERVAKAQLAVAAVVALLLVASGVLVLWASGLGGGAEPGEGARVVADPSAGETPASDVGVGGEGAASSTTAADAGPSDRSRSAITTAKEVIRRFSSPSADRGELRVARERALAALDGALGTEPDQALLLSWRAELARQSADPDAALADVRAAIDAAPGEPALHAQLGLVLLEDAALGLSTGRFVVTSGRAPDLRDLRAAADGFARARELARVDRGGAPGRFPFELEAAELVLAEQVARGERIAGSGGATETGDRVLVWRLTALARLRTDPRGALVAIERALASAPAHPQALLERGRLRHVTGEPGAAVADFERVLAIVPDGAAALVLRGLASWDLGERASAEADLDRAVGQTATPIPAARAVRAWMRLAASEAGSARSDLERLVAEQPGSLAARLLRAEARRSTRDARGALEDDERALSIASDDPRVYRSRALSRLALGRAEEALSDLVAAESLDASETRRQPAASAESGRLASLEACEWLLLRHRGAFAELYYRRGEQRRRSRDRASALRDFERAISLEPGHLLARLGRGILLAGAGDPRSALVDLDAAIAGGGRIPVDAWVARASVRKQVGDLVGAIQDLDRVIAAAPSARLHAERAEIRYSTQDYDGAVTDLDAAIALDRNDPILYRQRGSARRKGGDPEGAIADFSEAIRLQPRSPGAFFNRANAYYGLGRKSAALADYRRYVELDPAGEKASATRRRIVELEAELGG